MHIPARLGHTVLTHINPPITSLQEQFLQIRSWDVDPRSALILCNALKYTLGFPLGTPQVTSLSLNFHTVFIL